MSRVVTSAAIKIAVSGHRSLEEPARLEAGIRAAAARLQMALPGRQFVVWSCLAEGADRLLAQVLLETLPARLVLVLPLPEKEYLQDFRTRSSKKEYQALRRLAGEVIQPNTEWERPLAYQAANRLLVQDCQVLIAVWDGLPSRGPGGTAEIVEEIRLSGKPLLWIHAGPGAETGALVEERLAALTKL